MSMKWGTQFIPTGKFPVIANRVFKTLAEAQNYLNYTSADASAIPGLILSVIEDTIADNNGAYRITGTDGNLGLSKLADVEGINSDNKVTISGSGNNYTISQGGVIIGTINIPKDMVVSSGQVIIGTDGEKYLELTLANAPEGSNKVQINVRDLVDVYTGTPNGNSVKVMISDTNQISAEVSDGAITVNKITDGAVTMNKLNTDVKNTINIISTGLDGALSDISTLEDRIGWEILT